MSDDDIEFLDEDAEIVQQCVQSVHSQLLIKIEPLEEEEPPPHVIQKPLEKTLLVERPSASEKPVLGKKRKKEDDDTDYDPMLDSPHFKRRRRHASRPSSVRKYESSRSSQQSQSPPAVPVRKVALPREQVNRREMTIQIPDFDDPLCLPVRALVRDESDARRLTHWNQQCLDRFKQNNTPLRPRDGPVSSSKRTIVIRNVFNKFSGKTETTFWSKIVVEGKKGDTQLEVVQSVLPRYREKKILRAYRLNEGKRPRGLYERHEVLLTKETYGGEDTLVAYKPQNSLAMVFKMFESELVAVPETERRYLRELASAAACARCYQASYRAPRDPNLAYQNPPMCPVCERACDSAGALVAHVRSHAAADVRKHRRAICDVLVKLLPYLYRCRICQQQFGAVKDLHRHLNTHKGTGEFYCEVGNHTVS